jgi:hypothetical protein
MRERRRVKEHETLVKVHLPIFIPLFLCSAYYSTLKKEATCSYETSVNIYQINGDRFQKTMTLCDHKYLHTVESKSMKTIRT